jgi:hypothetical protein
LLAVIVPKVVHAVWQIGNLHVVGQRRIGLRDELMKRAASGTVEIKSGEAVGPSCVQALSSSTVKIYVCGVDDLRMRMQSDQH